MNIGTWIYKCLIKIAISYLKSNNYVQSIMSIKYWIELLKISGFVTKSCNYEFQTLNVHSTVNYLIKKFLHRVFFYFLCKNVLISV